MACNKTPPPEHPLHGSGVACHMREEHEGPCTWDTEPSNARKGIDKLLTTFAHREIESLDSQPERPLLARDVVSGEISVVTHFPPGHWVVVKFVGGDEFAIYKRTGAVHRVGLDGAVEDDPILEVA